MLNSSGDVSCTLTLVSLVKTATVQIALLKLFADPGIAPLIRTSTLWMSPQYLAFAAPSSDDDQ
jgi:hypothetical protein